jgi:hypothetical protein
VKIHAVFHENSGKIQARVNSYKFYNYSVASSDNENRRNERAFSPEMSRSGTETPFVKALENKKSSQIALRLNSCQIFKDEPGKTVEIPPAPGGAP